MINNLNFIRPKSRFNLLKGSLYLLFLLLFLQQPLSAVEEDLAPESDTGLQQSQSFTSQHSMVVTAHPLATQAGLEILQMGGTAADAAVAIQAMLTLVEPQSSGIGGGAFMLYWDQASQRLKAYDGRETAPAAADHSLFIQQGKPMPWVEAMIGGRSVGVPGVLKMLELAQQQHGKLNWSELFNHTIQQANAGFKVTPRLHKLIRQGINPGLNRYPEARNYFFNKDGSPLAVGQLLQNPELANSLQLIAEEGSKAFYQGVIAEQIVNRVSSVADNPGLLTLEDMAAYQAKERDPLCLPYLSYRLCGFPPPTSGGVTVLQILKLLEQLGPVQPEADPVYFAHQFTQASRLAFADRARYLADSDFVEVPTQALLEPSYLAQRAKLIQPQQDMGRASPGKPEAKLFSQADDQSPELPSTSHLVVVDRWGNAVSMTTSIEMAFGSTLMAGGFLLNNQLTDFSFKAINNGRIIANRVQPNKRPRSSMSPFMVFDQQGQLHAAVGSPGGSRIINYVAQSLLWMLNTDLALQDAINQPHISNRNGLTELEAGTPAEQLQSQLEKMRHKIKIRDLNSGLHALRKLPEGGWESGVDNRREGLALGQ